MSVVATDQGEKDSWGREFILGFMNAAPPTDTEITEITDMTLTLTTLVDADVTVRITSNAANVTSNLQLSTTVRRGAHRVGNMCAQRCHGSGGLLPNGADPAFTCDRSLFCPQARIESIGRVF